MKFLIGLFMLVGGIAFGLYAGIWWAFIGGIVDVIEAIRAVELSAIDVAIGVAKVLFSGLIGWLSFSVIGIPGYLIIKDS